MISRIINGILYVLLIGALMVGGLVWFSLLTCGLWYISVIVALLIVWAFILGYLSEGGGGNREQDAA
ncbi:hypothetical protein [Paenibacillus sp. FSL K6-2859]|uniref:hypothetical protein n=1 Tax=Paenibacillus sp. FSL K6-2859 TaxID=2921482 RepID=UPI0030F5C5D3